MPPSALSTVMPEPRCRLTWLFLLKQPKFGAGFQQAQSYVSYLSILKISHLQLSGSREDKIGFADVEGKKIHCRQSSFNIGCWLFEQVLSVNDKSKELALTIIFQTFNEESRDIKIIETLTQKMDLPWIHDQLRPDQKGRSHKSPFKKGYFFPTERN